MSAVETAEVTLPTLEDLGFYVNYWSATLEGLLEVYGITSLVRLQFALALGTMMLVAFEQWRLNRHTDKQLRAAGLLPPPQEEKRCKTGLPSDDNLMSSGVLRARAREDQLVAQKKVQEQARELLQQMEAEEVSEFEEEEENEEEESEEESEEELDEAEDVPQSREEFEKSGVWYCALMQQPAERFRDFLNRLMCTIAALLFFLFPFLGTGDYHYKEDAFNQDAKANYVDKDTLYSRNVASLIYHWCNRSGQQELGQKFACKNVMFMNKVATGRILVNASGIDHIAGESVVFQDGTRAPRCECLVLCTGYRDVFPFLKGNIGDSGLPLSVPENNVRGLFKHVFHPEIGKSMAWIGFARPSTGGIPACAEMAARYFALLLANQRELPYDIAQRTAREGKLDERYYCLSPDVKTLVGYKDWMDSMAELIGCEVQLWRYVFQPKLFVRLCIGSLLPCQYRLRGPGRLKEAKTTVLSLPVAATRWQSIVEARDTWRRHLRLKRLWPGDE